MKDMEMKVKDEKFYILEANEEKWIHDTEKSAVQSLKKMVSENEELNTENVSIIEVNPMGNKWKIQEVPWSKIAIELIRVENKC